MKRHVKPLLFIIFVAAAFLLMRHFQLPQYLEKERLRAALEAAGVWAPLIFIAIYAVAPAFFLPGLPLTLLAGLLFGPVAGVIYAITGATIGATASFLIARYLVRDWVARRIAGTRMAALYERAEREGWKLVAVTRLIPLFPFNLLNYAFGITAIPLWHYVVTSLVCMLPACVAYVVFGSSLPDVLAGRISPKFIIGIGLIVLLNLVIVAVRKRQAVAR
jgi:uncharacterized membrane protein YdjX (TVP38/TMEM64 family)